MPEDITSETLPGADDTALDGRDTVENVEDNANEAVREAISAAMGRDFKTTDDALKSVKETHKFVGSVGKIRNAIDAAAVRLGTDVAGVLNIMETIQPQQTGSDVAQTQAASVASTTENRDDAKQALAVAQEATKRVDEFQFFQSRPELASFKGMLTDLRDKMGMSLTEVAEMPTIKPVLEKARAHDEADGSLSVMHSNPKIGASRDKMNEAQEANKAGNAVVANRSAVDAVIDAFDLAK